MSDVAGVLFWIFSLSFSILIFAGLFALGLALLPDPHNDHRPPPPAAQEEQD